MQIHCKVCLSFFPSGKIMDNKLVNYFILKTAYVYD